MAETFRKTVEKVTNPRVLAVAAAGGAILLGGNVIMTHAEHEQRYEALQRVDSVDTTIFGIKSGANLRITPKTINDGDPNNDNIAYQIPEGKMYVVKFGLEDSENPGWVAFTEPGTETQGLSAEDRSDVTLYANVEQLKAENMIVDLPRPVGGKGGDTSAFLSKGLDNLPPEVATSYTFDADQLHQFISVMGLEQQNG